MNLRQHLQAVRSVLVADETLLRLLHYKPADAGDDPLDSGKPDILAMAPEGRDTIITDVIRNVRDIDDLTTEEKCRLVYYPRLRKETSNHLIADQDIAIDVYCHYSFEETDGRSAWVADRANALLFGKHLASVGRTFLRSGNSIAAPSGYAGYRLIYTFGSENY
ncbi:hypothetical protein [Paenibacillus cymbidii]|uniref:hypothetical protein n=1 Tax=Paenibacillus cymbidii TaxID=1639034 RepID=UPI001080A668|nr:hypothetical protein [Paenibacillus cymbidii]